MCGREYSITYKTYKKILNIISNIFELNADYTVNMIKQHVKVNTYSRVNLVEVIALVLKEAEK